LTQRRRLLVALIGLATLIGMCNPALAVDAPPPGLTMEAEAAFGGLAKYGEWLPVWVHLENDGPDLAAEVQITLVGSLGTTTFAAPASLPTGSRKRLPVYVLPNNYSHELQVDLLAAGDVLLSTRVPIHPQSNLRYLVGFVAPRRGALVLLSGASLSGQERPKEFVDLAPADLPERPEGLRSFDLLVFDDVDTSDLSPQQAASLETWVQGGGRLVIGGGAGAQRTTAGLPDALLPFTPRGAIEVDALPGLADFAAADPVRVPGPFVVATGAPRESRILAGQEDLPLLAERVVGSGAVDFVALDLAVTPFDAWTGTAAFWERLIAPGSTYPEWFPVDVSPRQLQANSMSYVITNLPALDLPSIRWVGILLILYVILVGPANYLVLRRRKRLHWAWITIPLLTLAFSAGAFGVGYVLRGTGLILNKIAIVEPRTDGTAAVQSYLGLYSPAQESYDVEVRGGGLLAPLNPDYLPQNVGVVSRSSAGGSAASHSVTFLQGDPGRIRGLGVSQFSMNTFMTEGTWTDFGRITGDLWIEGDELVGTIHNETAQTLLDAVLILEDRFVRLGDLPPGGETPVAMSLPALADRRIGTPLAYRLFEDQLAQAGIAGPPRTVQLKQSLVERFFNQYGGLTFEAGALGQSRASVSQAIELLAWLQAAPPEVQVAGRTLDQQTLALLHLPLPYRLPDHGPISLPPGLIPGLLVQTPDQGGSCGQDTTSVWINRGDALLEFQVPLAVQDLQIEALTLLLTTDSSGAPPGAVPPDVALYDWRTMTWRDLADLAVGQHRVSDPAGLVRADGLVRVKLSSDGNRQGGCFYVDLGLEGVH
jgi:hypothetical protein